MNAGELHRLARVLRDVALASTSRPGEPVVPASLVAVVEDVADHPDSSVGEIAVRTGLAQSMVSTTVVRLRDSHVLRTTPDVHDRRRTLVSLTPSIRGTFHTRGGQPIEGALRAVLPGVHGDRLERVMGALDVLGQELLS